MMTERSIYISAYQLGVIDALKDIINLPEILEYRKSINVDNIIYSSLFQCGTNKINIQCHSDDIDIKSMYLKSRIGFIEDNKYGKMVSGIFQTYLPEKYYLDDKYNDIVKIEYFLSDLLFATEIKNSFINMLKLPELTNIRKLIPAELFFLLSNLLSKFEVSNEMLPLPKMEIDKSDVRIFEDILMSDLFKNYSIRHAELESSLKQKEIAISEIFNAGEKLYRNNNRQLKMKNIVIAVLPISNIIIDTIFGKLPGKLAEYSTKLLSESLKENRRIICFQLDSVYKEMIEDYIINVIKKNI